MTEKIAREIVVPVLRWLSRDSILGPNNGIAQLTDSTLIMNSIEAAFVSADGDQDNFLNQEEFCRFLDAPHELRFLRALSSQNWSLEKQERLYDKLNSIDTSCDGIMRMYINRVLD